MNDLSLCQAADPGMSVIAKEQGHVTSIFRGYKLHSFFQPIFSVAHRRVIGYEGLVRPCSNDGKFVSPAELFDSARNYKELQEVDVLCRELHTSNFFRQRSGEEWLFVNLNSQLLVSDKPEREFPLLFNSHGQFPPYSVVVEILENEINNLSRLQHLIAGLREQNCLIAIDDFGAGYSNFDRIWKLEPDIVKVDRELIREASCNQRAERILSGMISLLHEAGSLVIVEGIETEREACVAIDANADMVQGFLFARPSADLQSFLNAQSTMDRLLDIRKVQHSNRVHLKKASMQPVLDRFQRLVNDLKQGSLLHGRCHPLFEDPRVTRCYLLDQQGYQLEGYKSECGKNRESKKLAQLMTGQNGNWAHRPYHGEALHNLGQPVISAPYLSILNARMCSTVSQAFVVNHEVRVVCFDIEHQD